MLQKPPIEVSKHPFTPPYRATLPALQRKQSWKVTRSSHYLYFLVIVTLTRLYTCTILFSHLADLLIVCVPYELSHDFFCNIPANIFLIVPRMSASFTFVSFFGWGVTRGSFCKNFSFQLLRHASIMCLCNLQRGVVVWYRLVIMIMREQADPIYKTIHLMEVHHLVPVHIVVSRFIQIETVTVGGIAFVHVHRSIQVSLV